MNSRLVSYLTTFASILIIIPFASADTFKIDPVHSQAIFQVSHMGVSKNFGRFNTLQGSFITDDDASKISFEASVPVESLDTGNAMRDKHLKTPDFFNAKQFPDITFKSTSAKKTGDDLELTGDLTLHGVTKPITVTLTKVGQAKVQKDERAGYTAQFTVKRSDYGMTFMNGPVGDDVSLWLNIEGVKQ